LQVTLSAIGDSLHHLASTEDEDDAENNHEDEEDSGLGKLSEEDKPGWVLRGFLVPIINTTFIELSTAAYPNISFSPRLILRLNFSFLFNKNSRSKTEPQPFSSIYVN